MEKAQDDPAGLQSPDHRKGLTPQAYAEAVAEHAEKSTESSLYPGQNFENLARYLLRPYDYRTLQSFKLSEIAEANFPVTVYNFHPSKLRHRRILTKSEDLAQTIPSQLQNHEGQPLILLFLRGQPCSSWLSAIGAIYQVDPEYFQRHLDFRSTLGRLDHFALPSLPSASNQMIKLRYSTICQSDSESSSDERCIDLLRRNGKKDFERYMYGLNQCIEKGTGIGNSIVRAYDVYDEIHSSLEQEISIYVGRTATGPVCLIWLDTANDLTQDPEGPWFRAEDREAAWPHTIFHPTIQQLQKAGLKSHRTAISQELRPNPKFAQSSMLLHLDYGNLYDSSLIATDTFYALNQLFSFCAHSEIQLLNLIESKLSEKTGYALLSDENPQLSNLQYMQDVLERHTKRLGENIETIRARGSSKWPRASDPIMKQKAETAADSLQKDYEHLLFRANSLSERCQRGIRVIMSNASINESRRGIAQTFEVAKLTRLAFIFVPLGFTTSFFGMNLAPLVNGRHSLWLWFVVSFPLILASIVALSVDIPTLIKRAHLLPFRRLKRS